MATAGQTAADVPPSETQIHSPTVLESENSMLANNIANGPPVADWEKRVAQMGEFVALKLFIDWEVFENIPLQGTISYAELASKLNVEVSLLSRFSASCPLDSY